MPSPYPNAYQIEEVLANHNIPDVFHTYLANHIDVTVVVQELDVGGHYDTMRTFQEVIYARVSAALKVETIRVEKLCASLAVETQPWLLWSNCVPPCPNMGHCYSDYHLELVDLVRFDSQGKIAYMKEFLDSGHLQNYINEHKEKT